MADFYESMQNGLGWVVPDDFNMAEVCSRRWAAQPDAAQLPMLRAALEVAGKGVTVNAVCPGVIISRWLDDHPEMIDAAIKITPLKRASTTDDIADAITFLACDAGMMTGQALVVDGGVTFTNL